MTVLAFCMTPPGGAPKIRNPNGQSIEAEITLTGYYDGLKKASGLLMNLDRYMRREMEELRLVRFDIGQGHEREGLMRVLVCRGDFG